MRQEGRYARQMAIRGWEQERLSKARVLVLGAGTTGNEVIKNLGLLGVGKIVIVDKDEVEEVNLNRCVLFREEDIGKPKAEVTARRVKELAPEIEAEAWVKDIVYEIGALKYPEFDCVVLTVDNLEARMWVNKYCWRHRVPLIDTGTREWIGNVFVMQEPFEVCIECGWQESHYRRLFERYSCSRIGVVAEERKIPMVITSAAVVGGIAAQEVVKVLMGRSSLGRNFYWFDGEVGEFRVWEQPAKPGCRHEEYGHLEDEDIEMEVGLEQSVEEIREQLKQKLGAKEVEIYHDKEVVYRAGCRHCGYQFEIQPTLLGRFHRQFCPRCGQWKGVALDVTEELKGNYTLKELGVPPEHVLKVVSSREEDLLPRTTWAATAG